MAAKPLPLEQGSASANVRSWVGQCQRTRGCVKEAFHRGSCQLGDIAEVEYEVETIVDEQPGPKGALFLVKWRGWPSEDNTWERLEALSGCPEVLRAWRAKRPAASLEGDGTAAPPPKRRQSPAAGSRDARAPKSGTANTGVVPPAANGAGKEPKNSAKGAAAARVVPRGVEGSASALAAKGAAGDARPNAGTRPPKHAGAIQDTISASLPGPPPSRAGAKHTKKKAVSVVAAPQGVSAAADAAPAKLARKKGVEVAGKAESSAAAYEPGQAPAPIDPGPLPQKSSKEGDFSTAEGLAPSVERPKSRRAFVGQCKRTEGCVKETGHRGRCQLGDIAEVEYEVETIVDEQPGPPGGLFLVKWRSWPSEDNTWERLEALAGCPQVLRAWRAKKAEAAASVSEAPPAATERARGVNACAAAAASASAREEGEALQPKATVGQQPPAALASPQEPNGSKGHRPAAAAQKKSVGGARIAASDAGGVAGCAGSGVETAGRKKAKIKSIKSRAPSAAVPSAAATLSAQPGEASAAPSQRQPDSAGADSGQPVRSQGGVESASGTLPAAPARQQAAPQQAAPQHSQTVITETSSAESSSMIAPAANDSPPATGSPRCMPGTAPDAEHAPANAEAVLAAESTASAQRTTPPPMLPFGEQQPPTLPSPLGVCGALPSGHPGEPFRVELTDLLEDEAERQPSNEGHEGEPSAEHESSALAASVDAAEPAARPCALDSCSPSPCSVAVEQADSSPVPPTAAPRAAETAEGVVRVSAPTEAVSQQQSGEQQVPSMPATQTPADASITPTLPPLDAQLGTEVAPPVAVAGPPASRGKGLDVVSKASAGPKQPKSSTADASGSGQRKGRAAARKSNTKDRDRRRLPTAGAQRWNRKEGRFVASSDSETIVDSDSDTLAGSTLQGGDAILHMLRGIESAPIAQLQAGGSASRSGVGNADLACHASVDLGSSEGPRASKSKTNRQVDGGVGAVLEIIGDRGIAELAEQRKQAASIPAAALASAPSAAVVTCSSRIGTVDTPTREGPTRLLSLRGIDASSELGRPTSPVHAPLRASARKGHASRSKPTVDTRLHASAGKSKSLPSAKTPSVALPPLQARSRAAAPRPKQQQYPGVQAGAQLEAAKRGLKPEEAGAIAGGERTARSIVSESDFEYEIVDDEGDSQDDAEGREARAFAAEVALESEQAAQNGAAPLLAHPLDPSAWKADLPHAPHVLYAALPPRPSGLRGHFLFGWEPEGHSWDLDRPPAGANIRDALIYCDFCTASFEEEDNEIVQCDGEDCGAAYHMRCLEPPLTRMPRGAWYCSSCFASRKAAREAKRQAARRAREEENKEELSAYEQERLSNIARNEAFLADLGLQ